MFCSPLYNNNPRPMLAPIEAENAAIMPFEERRLTERNIGTMISPPPTTPNVMVSELLCVVSDSVSMAVSLSFG